MTVHFFMSALIKAHLSMKTVILFLLSFHISPLPFGRREGQRKGGRTGKDLIYLVEKKPSIAGEPSQRIRIYWYCFKTAVLNTVSLCFCF